jgi:hypothetical protein
MRYLRLVLALVVGSWTVSVSPAEPESDAPGALRAAGVIHVGTLSEFKGSGTYNDLLDYGVEEASIVDGSMMFIRLLCCSENHQASGEFIVYNPQHLPIADGDFVEIRVGNSQSHDLADAFNTLTRVLAHYETDCRWEPKDNQRVLRRGMGYVYCDWMPSEGWLKLESKVEPAWYKPAPVSVPDKPSADR